MDEKKNCFLCKTLCDLKAYFDNRINQPVYYYNCPTCGFYEITHRAQQHLISHKDSFYIISGITRRYFEEHDSPFTITEQIVQDKLEFEANILSKEPKYILDKIAILLQYIARESNYPGDVVKININNDYPICFCKEPSEMQFFIEHVRKTTDIEKKNYDSGEYRLILTARGWEKVENINKPNIESKQAFVAMWFNESMDEVFEGGFKAIEEDTGFDMFRVDKTQFIEEKICDKIIAEIKKSRFLIADVTGQRQAVYFEAGFAMGMGIPVIWTSKKDDEKKCCFDTRQYPHIFYENTDELKNQLKERIIATIGKG